MTRVVNRFQVPVQIKCTKHNEQLVTQFCRESRQFKCNVCNEESLSTDPVQIESMNEIHDLMTELRCLFVTHRIRTDQNVEQIDYIDSEFRYIIDMALEQRVESVVLQRLLEQATSKLKAHIPFSELNELERFNRWLSVESVIQTDQIDLEMNELRSSDVGIQIDEVVVALQNIN